MDFHYFTLEEVRQYAEKMGFAKEDVEVEEFMGYDYDEDKEFVLSYTVSFGQEYTEMWVWQFESLEEPAVDYDHLVWED